MKLHESIEQNDIHIQWTKTEEIGLFQTSSRIRVEYHGHVYESPVFTVDDPGKLPQLGIGWFASDVVPKLNALVTSPSPQSAARRFDFDA